MCVREIETRPFLLFLFLSPVMICSNRKLIDFPSVNLTADICSAICKGFSANKDHLREHFLRTVLSLPQIAEADWRVDFVLSSSLAKVRSWSMCLAPDDPNSNNNILFDQTTINRFNIHHFPLHFQHANIAPFPNHNPRYDSHPQPAHRPSRNPR